MLVLIHYEEVLCDHVDDNTGICAVGWREASFLLWHGRHLEGSDTDC